MPLSPHPQRPAFLLIWIGLVTGVTGMAGNSFLREPAVVSPNGMSGSANALPPLETREMAPSFKQIRPSAESALAIGSFGLPEDQIRGSENQNETSPLPQEETVQILEAAVSTPSPVVSQPRFPSWYRSLSSSNRQDQAQTAYANFSWLEDGEDEMDSDASGTSLRIQRARNGLAWFMATFQAETPEELYFQMKGFLADLPEASRARIQEDLEDEGSNEGNPRARARAVLHELKRHGMFELAAQMTPEQARHLMAKLRARRQG